MCQQSQKAKYTGRVDYIIQLPVPMDQATNAGIRLTVAANARRPVSASTYSGGWGWGHDRPIFGSSFQGSAVGNAVFFFFL